ncbi:MAG: HAD family hydrolase [Patescibacteria group bacterium]|jgi:phosphoglycolate phosphatase-like HAD superfamily hydrolase
MNKAFIFDWSGTLSDNSHLFLEVCRRMFIELGKEPISEDEMRRNFTLPYMKFWNKYFPDLSKEKQDELNRKYMQLVGKPELYSNVKEVIEILHQRGFKLFILSSDHVLLPEVQRLGLSGLMTEVIGAIHDKKDVIVSLLEKYQLDKDQTFYVGDTSGDVEAGKHAMVKTIGISWGFQHKDILAASNPDYLVDDIIEIKNILFKS